VAEVENASLLTLRVALAAVTASRGRSPGGHTPGELGNPYGADPAREAWARQGAYLAEVRARTSPDAG
jgi:hypothetical protein